MNSISANSNAASVPANTLPHKKNVELAEAAAMLLPGLQQARTQLDLAIRVLSHFAPPPPEGAISNAEAAVRIRRALAAFGHPSVRR